MKSRREAERDNCISASKFCGDQCSSSGSRDRDRRDHRVAKAESRGGIPFRRVYSVAEPN